jgi:NAD(P)-dependent dehydrogenase (short-subunit alcohol dehydrogenase family)
MSTQHTVLVAGVHGVSGRAAAEHWAALPGTQVHGLGRRSAPLPAGVEGISADLLDRDDLQRKLGKIRGEPPVSRTEEALMAFLDIFLERTGRGEVRPEILLADFPDLVPEGVALVQAAAYIDEFMANVLEHSSVLDDAPLPPVMATEGEQLVSEVLHHPHCPWRPLRL